MQRLLILMWQIGHHNHIRNTNMCALFLFLVILSISQIMARNLQELLLFCCLVLVRAPQLKHIIMLSSSGPKFFHVQFQMCSATHVINILCLGSHHHLMHLQMGGEKLQIAQFLHFELHFTILQNPSN